MLRKRLTRCCFTRRQHKLTETNFCVKGIEFKILIDTSSRSAICSLLRRYRKSSSVCGNMHWHCFVGDALPLPLRDCCFSGGTAEARRDLQCCSRRSSSFAFGPQNFHSTICTVFDRAKGEISISWLLTAVVAGGSNMSAVARTAPCCLEVVEAGVEEIGLPRMLSVEQLLAAGLILFH